MQALRCIRQTQIGKRILGFPRGLYAVVERHLYAKEMRSRVALTLPDFLGIGAQKAGTTWLYENLRFHPELYLPPRKELHYFDWRFNERSLIWYTRHFEPGRALVKGEITPDYSSLPISRIAWIQDFIPDLRLILLLRNPVDRAWSQAVMVLAKRGGIPVEAVDDATYLAFLKSQACRQLGDYTGILDRWLSVFSREQLFIGFFEDIVDRPQGLLADVFTHLGVTKEVDWSRFPYAQRIHEGARQGVPARFRSFLETEYHEEIEALYERLGAPIAEWRTPSRESPA